MTEKSDPDRQVHGHPHESGQLRRVIEWLSERQAQGLEHRASTGSDPARKSALCELAGDIGPRKPLPGTAP
jgi:hypothetical protein